ncbi:short-chain specific acyl-CoA dehydrogenase [Terfezia claveryi]|nr:short-chain specific acyl-CoA dehydrogenase [Terfezia claveryi]
MALRLLSRPISRLSPRGLSLHGHDQFGLSLLRPFSSTPRRQFSADLLDTPPNPIFHLTETEQMLQETVSRFAQSNVLPKVREMDEVEAMDEGVIEGLFENGFMGIEIPEEFGGSGMGFGAAIVAIEELAKVDPSVSVLSNMVLMWGVEYPRQHRIPEIRLPPPAQDIPPPLATSSVGSFCLSEPSSGSDAFAMLTTAIPTTPSSSSDPSSYTINGSKCWITNASHSKIFLVFAQTNPNLPSNQRHKGITCFVVPRDTPGFSVSKKEKKLGIRASSTCVVTFDDVQVPSENILGSVGEGYKIAMNLLNEGRVGIGAQMIGLAQGAFDTGAKYVFTERKQFGRFIAEFQGLGFQVAEARLEIEAARALVYNAVRTKEREEMEAFVMKAAMAKLYASRVAQNVSGSVVEWMGGMGFVRDGLAEKMWRDSKIGAIYEGTSNIQLQTIARLLQKDLQKDLQR